MSNYSDWKCGALTDDEYRDMANWEARRDAYEEAKMYDEDSEDEETEEEEDNDEQ